MRGRSLLEAGGLRRRGLVKEWKWGLRYRSISLRLLPAVVSSLFLKVVCGGGLPIGT